MTAIVLGLNHPFIRRLTNSWSNVSDCGWTQLEALEALCLDCSVRIPSWKIKDVMDESLESKRIIIPFWGVYMMEAKIASDSDSFIRPLLFNWDRFRKMSQVTRKMMSFSKMVMNLPVPFERHEGIRHIILSKKIWNESAWWNMVSE